MHFTVVSFSTTVRVNIYVIVNIYKTTDFITIYETKYIFFYMLFEAFRMTVSVKSSWAVNLVRLSAIFFFLFIIKFYLQSALVHSANCVKTYTVACRRVLSSTSL
jgi:hypothetical protein